MNRTSWFRYAAAAGLFTATMAATVGWAQANQSSLGDVARQKSAPRARRVITNDEIPPSPEANNPPSPSNPGTTPAAKQDGAKSDSAPEKPTKLQELMSDREHLQKTLKKTQDQLAATDDEHRKATLGAVIEHTKELLDENQKEIDQLRASEPAAENSTGANPPAADHSPGGQQPPK